MRWNRLYASTKESLMVKSHRSRSQCPNAYMEEELSRGRSSNTSVCEFTRSCNRTGTTQGIPVRCIGHLCNSAIVKKQYWPRKGSASGGLRLTNRIKQKVVNKREICSGDLSCGHRWRKILSMYDDRRNRQKAFYYVYREQSSTFITIYVSNHLKICNRTWSDTYKFLTEFQSDFYSISEHKYDLFYPCRRWLFLLSPSSSHRSTLSWNSNVFWRSIWIMLLFYECRLCVQPAILPVTQQFLIPSGEDFVLFEVVSLELRCGHILLDYLGNDLCFCKLTLDFIFHCLKVRQAL